ncbi:MAG: DNA repair protein [Lachnospiraceae bacterium]
MEKRWYLAIDLKSFYASVECRERGLDPMTTNLVVADPDRTEKTICLAVSPALKAIGIPGRCRVFELPKHVSYIMAPPRMQLYIDYSAEIYGIYLKYLSKEDIHVYSIDEIIADVTDYLPMYQMTAEELGMQIMGAVYQQTGITATCGIGTNMYLAKVALDIMAKHTKNHIGILDEMTYRKTLWDHKPITDFWRVGKGIATRLKRCGITTMGEVAHADEDLLYRMFGVDAELLIDHAWGEEPTRMADIKQYKSKENSISSGQMIGCNADFEGGKLIVKEMADLLSLELVEKGLVTDTVSLYISYPQRLQCKAANGTQRMTMTTSSATKLMECAVSLYERIVDRHLPIRKITITYQNVVDECYQQYDLFTDPVKEEREHKLQQAMLDIKGKFGKNAILKGMNLQKGATTIERNQQIGGHRSGE